MSAVVQHAHGFLRTLGLRNVHPVGRSRGAYLVARLTLEHPELFRSCILVDTNTLAPRHQQERDGHGQSTAVSP
jgi:2-hydroxy-6-oxonona-2,4-dienedioate hydrolase